jgi:predicted secreted protein
MSVLSGTAGSVVYGGTAGTIIAGLKTWSLDVAAAELDASNFGSTWRLTDSGIKEWSGSFEGNYDDADTYQTTLWTNLTTGVKAVVQFVMGTADYFHGTVVMTGHSPSQSFDGLGAASWNFKGHGPLTRV